MTTATKPDFDSYTLPKGTYFIGDPSYVLKEDDWNALLDGALDETGITELHGHKMFILADGPGDGSYKLQDGTDDEEEPWTTYINVDSGCWGVIPVELLIDEETTEDDLYESGVVFDSSAVEDDDGPLKEWDVDVIYTEDGYPQSVEICYYNLTIVE